MDMLSLAVGFLVGAATGAAGNYIADGCTDSRRAKKLAKEQDKLWAVFETKHAKLIAEMRADLSNPETQHCRAFFIKSSKTTLGGVTEPSLEYHIDKHPNLQAAVLFLEEHEFITNITTENCSKYRIHHRLVEKLSV